MNYKKTFCYKYYNALFLLNQSFSFLCQISMGNKNKINDRFVCILFDDRFSFSDLYHKCLDVQKYGRRHEMKKNSCDKFSQLNSVCSLYNWKPITQNI